MYLNFYLASSTDVMSSPNLLENTVANCFELSSGIEIRHRIFICGAISLILISSSKESAVVYNTLFF